MFSYSDTECVGRDVTSYYSHKVAKRKTVESVKAQKSLVVLIGCL